MTKNNRFKFTETRLGKIKPGDRKKRYYDTAVPSLCLVVLPSGRMTFVVYKKVNGKPRTNTIGQVSDISIEGARKEALKILAQYIKGEDPAKSAKAKWTLEKWLSHYVKDRKIKQSTAIQYQRAFKNYSPNLYKQQIAKISRDMVLTTYKKIESGDISWKQDDGEKYEMKKGSPAQANLWARALRAVYNYAVGETEDELSRSALPKNPVSVLSRKSAWFDVARRKTRIRDNHLPLWIEAIDTLLVDCLVSGLETRAAFCDRLLFYIFTGLRSVEAQDLTWDRVRLHDRYFWIEETKSGDPIELPITDSLMSILSRRRALCGDNPYVFGIEGSSRPVGDIRKTIIAVTNILKELENVRAEQAGTNPNPDVYKRIGPQDIRRTYASVVFTQFYSAYIIKRLLNHSVEDKRDVTIGYLTASADELRPIAEKVESFILNESLGSDNDKFPEELETVLRT